MKKIITLIVAVAAFQAFADSSVGCGLGSLVWKDQSIVSALFRATTNHSFSSQLFGITTGTSGCSRHSIVKADMAPTYFAEANLETLRFEMAMGEGRYLGAFAETLGCPADLKPEFFNSTQANYEKIFGAGEVRAIEMLENVKKVVDQDSRLKGKCKYAII